jgi:hypothetical protein
VVPVEPAFSPVEPGVSHDVPVDAGTRVTGRRIRHVSALVLALVGFASVAAAADEDGAHLTVVRKGERVAECDLSDSIPYCAVEVRGQLFTFARSDSRSGNGRGVCLHVLSWTEGRPERVSDPCASGPPGTAYTVQAKVGSAIAELRGTFPPWRDGERPAGETMPR